MQRKGKKLVKKFRRFFQNSFVHLPILRILVSKTKLEASTRNVYQKTSTRKSSRSKETVGTFDTAI